MYRRMCCGVDFHRVHQRTWGWLLEKRKQSCATREVVCRGECVLLKHVQRLGAGDRLGAALDAQFAVDAVDMPLHRADGDDEFPRDLGIGQAPHQEP